MDIQEREHTLKPHISYNYRSCQEERVLQRGRMNVFFLSDSSVRGEVKLQKTGCKAGLPVHSNANELCTTDIRSGSALEDGAPREDTRCLQGVRQLGAGQQTPVRLPAAHTRLSFRLSFEPAFASCGCPER